MKLQNTLSRILDGLILLVFILFFSSAGFQDRNTSGWYQQWFPNLNGSTIKDITFLDSLTGFAVTDAAQSYILRTTNGGDNWEFNYSSGNTWGFRRIISTDSSTIFAVRSYTEILKTTNRGNNWSVIPLTIFCDDVSILNKDTMLVVNSNPPEGGVYRSTNGGYNWQYIWTSGTSGNPSKIYMVNNNLGFTCIDSQHPESYRTIDGGFTWSNFNDSNFVGIDFLDSLTGWKGSHRGIQKTTDGGLTWIWQLTPKVFSFVCNSISIINKDTLWFVGCNIINNNKYYGVICKTTNGGLNWGYQLPDTSILIGRYNYINFVNDKTGWSYNTILNTGVHTNTGGIINGISNNQYSIISDYQLSQNYPNPFNATSNLKYKILKSSNVKIEVMDVLGRRIQTIVNQKHSPGTYQISFDGNSLPSGIYFYQLIVDNKTLQTRRMTLLK